MRRILIIADPAGWAKRTAAIFCSAVLCASQFVAADQPKPLKGKENISDAALRDPTIPPVTAAPVSAASAETTANPARQMMVINGVPYLIVAGKRYKAGDMVEGRKLQKITETELWFKDGSQTLKIPLYVGIEKQVPDQRKKPSPPECTDTPGRDPENCPIQIRRAVKPS